MKRLKEYKMLNIRTGLCAVMLICCAILLVIIRNHTENQDSVAPGFSIEEGNIEYTEGEDVRVLIQGVNAIDDVDGDVTESIRVRNIHHYDDSEYAIITYTAKDSSNNIGAANRKVIYHGAELPTGKPMAEGKTETGNTESEESGEN